MSAAGISSVGCNCDSYQPVSSSDRLQRRQDFQNLASALSSNDLAGAQSAFAALQKDMPKLAGLQSSGGSSNPLTTDFQNLADALSKGDVSGAQDAFAKLQQDMKSARGAHHHHHAAAENTPTTSVLPNTGTSGDSDHDQDGSVQSSVNVLA